MLNFLSEHQGFITVLATAAIAFSAFLTVVLTAVTVALTAYVARENRLLRRASTEPEVIAYLNPHRRYGTVLAFIIENVGRGVARNVCCSLKGDKDDFNAHRVNPDVFGHQLPIRLLAPDRRMEWWFCRGMDLLPEPTLLPFQVSVTYETLSGEHRKHEYQADASQFKGIDAGQSSEEDMVGTLKNIECHVKNWTSGLERLKVDTMTTVETRRKTENRGRKADSTLERAQDGQ